MRGATLGYAMALGAAVCSGLNASLGRFLLDDGMSAWELTQMRSVVTVAVLAVVASTATFAATFAPGLDFKCA